MANRATNLDEKVFSISDLEHEGSKRLPKATRDFYNEGAMDLITLKDNVSSYEKFKIRPRVLRNVSDVDMSSSIFGQTISMPFGISPTAMQRLAHPDGEEATSRAARSVQSANVLIILLQYISGERGTPRERQSIHDADVYCQGSKHHPPVDEESPSCWL